MALGIPVVICRHDMDFRFSYLAELLPVNLPAQFDQIDWNPAPVDMRAIKSNLRTMLRERIQHS